MDCILFGYKWEIGFYVGTMWTCWQGIAANYMSGALQIQLCHCRSSE